MKTKKSAILILFMFSSFSIASEKEELEFFESKVRPLLSKHCYKCHSEKAKKIKGNLLLDSRQGWMTGGDSGTTIKPREPQNSLFMKSINYKDHDLQMPPKYKMKDEHIAIFKKWIESGATDPRESKKAQQRPTNRIDIEKGRQFWSFQALKSPQIPKVKNPKWSTNNIDRFLLRRMEEKNLKPAPDADKNSLIRRVYFDLIGSPPTPEQIDDFMADKSKGSLPNLIDQLMATSEFGERWGRHWLDVTRFAESSGGGRSLMFKDAWRFRDYIIRSFNNDKPFNRLILEHIAGDLLETHDNQQRNDNLIGSGYLMLGPTNYEQQDKALLKMEVVDEQLDTLGKTFLGMTLGCARCHDHPFDPIDLTDYYGMAGIFQSTLSLTPGNVSGFITQKLDTLKKKSTEQLAYEQRVKELSTKLKIVSDQLAKLNARPDKSVKQALAISLKSLPGIVIDNIDAKKIGKWQSSVFHTGYINKDYIHDQGQEKGKNAVIYEPKIEKGGYYEVRLSYTAGGNRATNVPVIIDHQDGQTTVEVNQSQQPPLGSFISLGSFRFEADTLSRVTISTKDTDAVVIADAVQFLSKKLSKAEKELKSTVKVRENGILQPQGKELAALQKKFNNLDKSLIALKKKRAQSTNLAMSVKDMPKPQNGHIHIRGEVRNLGPLVPRGFMRVAVPESIAHPPSIPTHSSGRLELATWLSSPENPLTARVFVNRIWHHLFVDGLVRTTDNFGAMGEKPSHPLLLDYLAKTFIDEGWSTKKIIRQIMLTRAYRMSSKPVKNYQIIDPANRLMSHRRLKRLEAESIRDTILKISNQLNHETGGLTIRKISTYDLDYKFNTNKKSIYVPAFRNSVMEIFEVFDQANPNLVIGKRNISTVPTQSLFMMNSPFVIKQAEFTARRILKKDLNQQALVNYTYRLILGRLPTTKESKLSETYLNATLPKSKISAWTNLCHSLFASIDFRYVY